MMGLKYPIEGPQYLLLYLMSREDAECETSSASFEIKMQMVEEDVDSVSCQVHSSNDRSPSNSVKKRSIKWKDTECLKFGPISPISLLKITLFKKTVQNRDSSRCIAGDEESASWLEYATASIPVEILRTAEHTTSNFKVEADGTNRRKASTKNYTHIDRIINMKILPMFGSVDAVSCSKHATSLSPESRVRAAEDAYHAALQSAIRSAHSQVGVEESGPITPLQPPLTHGEYLK